jgi:asparagine synthase (glutamine-hydrolysing)
MCGIVGIWSNTINNFDEKVIKKMTDVISHRGPDGEGSWISDDKTLVLGHRRLSIIDLSEMGKQPMIYADRYVITFNGEIYNYIEIKEQLKQEGYSFNTATDTEVIMAAYNYWGINCLEQFDGMFAFAIYDKQKQELFCARDRFGEKPFHYAFDEEKFMFASEMKSLWAAGVNRSIDDYSIYLFINMGLHEDPSDKTRTFFSKIKRLKPGHYFTYKKGGNVIQKCYWKLKSELKNDISFNDACIKFRELFELSISRRLRSDVDVGTSLSGGLDSAAVALVMNNVLRNSSYQKSFSARFNDPVLDEGFYMQKVIEKSGIANVEIYPKVESMINNIESIMYHQEEPFASASIFAQWEVYKLAKQNNVSVLLDGQGADEVFAGYTHFFEPYFREIYKNNGKSALLDAYKNYLLNNVIDDKIDINTIFLIETKRPIFFNRLRILKRAFKGVNSVIDIHPHLYNEFKRVNSPFNFFSDLNSSLSFYTSISGLDKLLRFADRNSMANSIEVRLPFLSHELVEFVFRLPSDYKIRNGWTKALIRYGLEDVLPKEITWRKNKLGFQPPQKVWEKSKLFIDYAYDMQQFAIKEKYISDSAKISWNGLVTGLFVKLAKD